MDSVRCRCAAQLVEAKIDHDSRHPCRSSFALKLARPFHPFSPVPEKDRLLLLHAREGGPSHPAFLPSPLSSQSCSLPPAPFLHLATHRTNVHATTQNIIACGRPTPQMPPYRLFARPALSHDQRRGSSLSLNRFTRASVPYSEQLHVVMRVENSKPEIRNEAISILNAPKKMLKRGAI